MKRDTGAESLALTARRPGEKVTFSPCDPLLAAFLPRRFQQKSERRTVGF